MTTTAMHILIIDLEVKPDKDGGLPCLYKLGAWRPDIAQELELDVNPRNLPQALLQLDELAQGAEAVLGHNIIEHDLPILHAYDANLVLHSLPVIDTLRLSPLAFPQNPYHRLIKDYKLVRDSLNSPLADCKTTWALFQDQLQAFRQLREAEAAELLCYQILLSSPADQGTADLFERITERDPLTPDALKFLLQKLLKENDPLLSRDMKVCSTRLSRLLDHDIQQSELRWSLAYALAWLKVSGGNSVLAPWVRYQFPETGRLISELRDVPCGQANCRYCATTHDPCHELKRYFGFDDFRREPDGTSLQHGIVLAGMQGDNVLAILATGGGKSLCYQLPALNRYHRNGCLTIIISPLQSLMKDQVDGLLARNIPCCASLNGLLTLPERADVLEKIQMGDVGILLVSPEQFRNKAFRNAIKHRQIGAWIFDEAHCLSKWGNDFRPDYLYVARFIREFSDADEKASIGCFTATAKPDVLEDIRTHFKEQLGIDFREFHGTHERSNLAFDVLPCSKSEKTLRTHLLLKDYLEGTDGGAVVFVATRSHAEEMADFLIGQRWACQYFHAGLEPNLKKDIQDEFKRGGLRVIVATNAFGMGVDKPDIRLVVHADIPGSLENYLQEAGRAGRDQEDAKCVLLYDEQDIENQFGMTERSRLSLRDVREILRKLRFEGKRHQGEKIIITAGEILLDDSVHTSFDMDDSGAETKVVTAVSWLERGDFLRRDENQTSIFPARLVLAQDAAQDKLLQAKLPMRRLQEYQSILSYLYGARADERISTDELMALTALTNDEVSSILRQLEAMGILINDIRITLYLRHGIAGQASTRLAQTLELETALHACLRELAPDAEDGSWQDLNLTALTSALKQRLEREDLLPLEVMRLLQSLAQDKDANSQLRSLMELRQVNLDYLKLRIKGKFSWQQIEAFGEKRRVLADKLLLFLVNKLSPGVKGKDLLVETTLGDLVNVIADDMELRERIPPDQRLKAVETVLLYMHRQEVLVLNHGMTVMRRAMTIDINEDKQGSFSKEDYRLLDEHYCEKRIQVHVMREYAETALKEMAAALQLVLDYFRHPRHDFLTDYFSGREDILQQATSEASWSAIVDALNSTQKKIVTDDSERNRLVLAGPGSGKTRVIVHRLAYLLRVKRLPPSSIIALAFNRHAAIEIRERLRRLVGKDAIGVNVMTYHSLAMRLTGTRFTRGQEVSEQALAEVMQRAVDLLSGRSQLEGEDDLREQLLRGYRYILVDEYQDIDKCQYQLVSALAGRQLEEDKRICLLAVGDDDQNIYAWRDSSNRYIEQFRRDYKADISYLVENYRSSAHIIDAANQLIAGNAKRLKADNPVVIDKVRKQQAKGGHWEKVDAERRGQVMRIRLPIDDAACGNLQAQAVMEEVQRLRALGAGWSDFAILARTHRYLWPLVAWCEQEQLPYYLASDKDAEVALTRQRAFVAVIDAIQQFDKPQTATSAWQQLRVLTPLQEEEWHRFFAAAFVRLEDEFGSCELTAVALVDWLYEDARELRRAPKTGIYLGTVHSAKGLEFPQVMLLDGGWRTLGQDIEDERRLYYVGMTRAKDMLTLFSFEGTNRLVDRFSGLVQRSFQGKHRTDLDRRFYQLRLNEVDIGFAGRQDEKQPVHAALARLKTSAPLTLHEEQERYLLLDAEGQAVGRTAKSFVLPGNPDRCEVAAVLVRYSDDGEDDSYRQCLRCKQWEVTLPSISWLPATKE